MSGPLIAALGLALLAWHIRALGGRISLHPRPLKNPLVSATVFLLGAVSVAFGGMLTVKDWGSGGIFVLILLGIAFVAVLLAGSARRAMLQELRREYDIQRRTYPGLDDEALFRFLIRDRHPDWANSRIQKITEDCSSLEDLALKLKGEEF